MSSGPNPLFGSWTPNQGINLPGLNMPGNVPGGGPSLPMPPGNPGSMNPYGQGTRGGGNQGFNLAQTNLQTGLLRNALAPQFLQQMWGAAQPAEQFYGQLTNLGSPFYQRKQQQQFEQGVQQGQNAAAQARQQIGAAGAGYTPSGAAAAMFGGMGQAQAQNQEEAFLTNLFQNEQLQSLGASGLMSLAQMFNPTGLLTGQVNPNIQQPTNTGAEWLGATGQAMGGLFGGGIGA